MSASVLASGALGPQVLVNVSFVVLLQRRMLSAKYITDSRETFEQKRHWAAAGTAWRHGYRGCLLGRPDLCVENQCPRTVTQFVNKGRWCNIVANTPVPAASQCLCLCLQSTIIEGGQCKYWAVCVQYILYTVSATTLESSYGKVYSSMKHLSIISYFCQ